MRVGLHPLAEVEATADAIADGDLDRRVPGDDAKTEVGRLALAFNTMLGRIQDAFAARDATEARLRRFVADASHELRTPVAAVSAYAELFERGANVRPDDLGRVMTGIRAETARMGDLVEDLLLLARLDEGRPLEQEPVELVTVAAQAIDASRAVGPDWPMQLDAAHPVEVMGDAARLRQVFDNLLGNVRSHTPPGTATTVRLFEDGDEAVIEVADNGPGLDRSKRAVCSSASTGSRRRGRENTAAPASGSPSSPPSSAPTVAAWRSRRAWNSPARCSWCGCRWRANRSGATGRANIEPMEAPSRAPSPMLPNHGHHRIGLLLLFVALIAIAALVAYLVVRITSRRLSPLPAVVPAGAPSQDAALQQLRLRYARGEISRTDYLQAAADLGAPMSPPPPHPSPNHRRRTARNRQESDSGRRTVK